MCPQDRLRQAQGERRGFGARLRCGLVGACRRPAHLWIPAFAGTTMAGVGSRRGGDAPAPGPCPGFPLSRERRWGSAGHAGAGGGGGRPSCALRTGFDRLRANGEGSKRACDVGWWGRAAARRTSGYRLSPVRRWRVWEVGEAETAPHRRPCPGFPLPRERRLGVCGTRGGWWRRRAHEGGPQDRLRQAQGERNRASPCPFGFGHSIGVGAGISRERRREERGTRGGWWWRRALRQAQGERKRASPLRFS